MAEDAAINQENQGLSGHFMSVDGVPLDQRMSIAVGPDNDQSVHAPANIGREEMTNFRHVLETGRVDADGYTGNRSDIVGNRQYIDWESDDAYTRAIQQVEENVTQRIQEDPVMQYLLEQEDWDLDDRMVWESSLSQIVSQELAEIPGLRDYRRTPGSPFQSPGEEADPVESAHERVTRLNDLSPDIENGTGNIEFDCEAMAITEGVIMQRIEDAHLPDSAEDGNYMQSSSYFYAGGLSISSDDGANIATNGHAYIISSATGGVIEATNTNGSPEYIMPREGFTFEDFASGAPFTARGTGTDSVYTGTYTGLHDPALLKLRQIEGISETADGIGESVSALRENPHWQQLQELMEVAEARGEITPELGDAYIYHFSEIYPDLVDLQGEVDGLEYMIDSAASGGVTGVGGIDAAPTEADTLAHTLYDVRSDLYSLGEVPSTTGIQRMIENGETLGDEGFPTLGDSVRGTIDATIEQLHEQYPDTVGPVVEENTIQPLPPLRLDNSGGSSGGNGPQTPDF